MVLFRTYSMNASAARRVMHGLILKSAGLVIPFKTRFTVQTYIYVCTCYIYRSNKLYVPFSTV